MKKKGPKSNYLLFSSLKIGDLTLQSRTVMPALHLNMTEDGHITERFIAFYEKRALLLGMLTIGGCAVNREAGGPHMIAIWDDSYVQSLARFVDRIKRVDPEVKVCAQLYHAGRYSLSFLEGTRVVAPSAIPSRLTGIKPTKMTKRDIKDTIKDFVNSAKRAQKAGFDAVEILASAGYLVCQFLSPITNRRSDEYGGSLKNRMRFGLELFDSVKNAVNDSVVGLRISGNEFMGTENSHPDEILLFCQRLSELGADYMNVTGGWHETRVPQLPYMVPNGNYVYLASSIKSVVGKRTAVFASNRLTHPWDMEKFIKRFLIDGISIGRALIADPEFLVKSYNRDELCIKVCISCNQGCFDRVIEGLSCGCTINPAAGHESEERKDVTSLKGKKIAVVGAGPSGLEASIRLGELGADVTIYEKNAQIGGQLNLASKTDYKWQYNRLITYYYNRIFLMKNISLQTRYSPTKDELIDGGYDAIVIATGARPSLPEIPGVNLPHVVTFDKILNGDVIPGRYVVIIGGGPVGVETAIHIKTIGSISDETAKFLIWYDAETPERIRRFCAGPREVTILKRSPSIAKGMGKSTRWIYLRDLKMLGIKTEVGIDILRIEENGVVCVKDGEKKRFYADLVVIACGLKSNNELFSNLKDLNIPVFVAGDAERVSNLDDAIKGAHRVVERLCRVLTKDT